MLGKQQFAPAAGTEPLALLVAAARRGIKQAIGARLRGSGLSPQQFSILMALHEQRGLSLRALCERRRIDAPTASRVVASLAAKRLLRSGGDRADRRRCRLELTNAGDALARRLDPLLHEIRRALVGGLSLAEQETLRDLLRRLIANAARLEQGPQYSAQGQRRRSTTLETR
jgi:DNA-binding MarR family transcriptional regulator